MPMPILQLEETGITVKRYGASPEKYRVGSTLISRVAAKIRHGKKGRKTIHPLEDWLRGTTPDLMVFSADCMAGLPGMQLAAKYCIPYTFIMQSNSESWWPTDAQRAEMNTAIDLARGSICFVGERNRDLFELQLGRRLPNSMIVRNPHAAIGLDPLPWPEVTGIETRNDPLRMAFVGRQEPIAKGQDILFQVLAQPQWRKRNWTLSLYGGGAGTQGVKAMGKFLGISERLTFVPSYSSIKEVWDNAHVLVMASRYEGLPLALVEAMYLGRPAVVTDVADCAIILREGIEGFVAASPSVADYSDAMERLWLHLSDLPQMGSNAALRARSILPANPVKDASDAILAIAK